VNVRDGFTLRGVSQERRGLRVLDEIDLDIRAGCVTVLIGASGAGKTTLLRLLNRLEDPVSGEIRYGGRLLADHPVRELRRRVGMVFQTPVMFEGTVAANLRAAQEISRAAAGSAQLHELLMLAGLDGAVLERRAAELSVGQQQRVCVARALAADPETLLLDEPTAALDAQSATQLLDTLRNLCNGPGLTVVMVTHRQAEARRIADRVVVLERGRIAAEGPPLVVLNRTAQLAGTP
jgi:ABC-type methionine transport system ATPase subunit